MKCKGIEIEPGVFSGCEPFSCPNCNGSGVVGWWNAECNTCWGHGEVKDCPVCCDGKLRPVNTPGLPPAPHGVEP